MALYKGKVTKESLVDTLADQLTSVPAGATEPFWKKIQSGNLANEGYVLHSKGKSGSDDLYIRIRKGTTHGSIIVSVMESYTPNPSSGLNGDAVNESHNQTITYYNGTYQEQYPVHYFLSFDRDKIMLVLKADPSVYSVNNSQVLMWVGLPKKVDSTDNSTRLAFAASRWSYQLSGTHSSYAGSQNRCMIVRNRRFSPMSFSYLRTLDKFKTKGWGDKILLPDMFVEDISNYEGIRSIMDGVYPIQQDASSPDFKDADEITVGTKRYTIFQVHNVPLVGNNSNCFPSSFMAVEHII